MLEGKVITVGVTGGIAVYKAVEVVRQLVKLGANVHVIMTDHAQEFVKPLTFQTLAQNKVVVDMFERPVTWEVEHIKLAQDSDCFLVVPATANIIGKMANGIGDDMLSTTLMATTAPLVIAPAMNTAMYQNKMVQRNMKLLKEELGARFVSPQSGLLACGDVGQGKLAEVEDIVEAVCDVFYAPQDMVGKKVLVTAGATREALDPVRFWTNHSTGKMGYEIARAAQKRGAEVVLVSGKTALKPPMGVTLVSVESAVDMYEAVLARFEAMDYVVKAAAVADYRPKEVMTEKLKKAEGNLMVEMVRNPDIAYELGQRKDQQVLIGFAAETENVEANALKKLEKKNLDFIVANNVKAEDAGFGTDTNVITIYGKSGSVQAFEKASKAELSHKIWDCVMAEK